MSPPISCAIAIVKNNTIAVCGVRAVVGLGIGFDLGLGFLGPGLA